MSSAVPEVYELLVVLYTVDGNTSTVSLKLSERKWCFLFTILMQKFQKMEYQSLINWLSKENELLPDTPEYSITVKLFPPSLVKSYGQWGWGPQNSLIENGAFTIAYPKVPIGWTSPKGFYRNFTVFCRGRVFQTKIKPIRLVSFPCYC